MTSENEKLAIELAEMEQECPTCGGGKAPIFENPCMGCHGTGKVFLFPDSVRVPCRQIHTLMGPNLSTIRNCPCAEVGCPGWRPRMDFVTWCWALVRVGAAAFGLAILDGHAEVSIAWLHGKQPVWAEDAEDVLAALARKEPS